MGLPKDKSRYGAARRALRDVSAAEEATLKAARTYGGTQYAPSPTGKTPGRLHQHFGFMIVSCERADLRPQADGVMIYGNEAVTLEPVPVPAVPRAEVIDELWNAVVEGRKPLHGGRWSMATMEVCLALLASAARGEEIALKHQIAPEDGL